MRILFDYRPALRQRTGVGEYVHQLATALVSQLGPGDDLTVFSSSWKDRLAKDAVTGAHPVDARVPVRLLNLAWHRLSWPPVELLAGHQDIAHAFHPLLIPARSAAQVVTINDLYFLDRPEDTQREIRRDYRNLASAHARRADHVIAISEYTAGLAANRLEVPSDRITVCRPGAPKWTPRQNAPSTGPILFIGTLEPRKNLDTLVRAYARVLASRSDAPPLVVAGRTTDQSAFVLRALSAPDMKGRARHVGYVTDAEREALYRGASMLVVPSLDEGFGMTALEAMTIGVPVIAANRGALPEVVGDAGMLIEPLDDAAIANAMQRLLDDPARMRSCADAGRRRAASFTWSDSATRLRGAYQSALRRRRDRGSA
ncbi:MAG: glycosyltransferase family 4 protein [Acidobacteria bacterium]|nr:glycosyltransferase family 4 protein [Acidobacteriota bacterium]MCA1650779.1 glycosyltransferase family 4 protein [Acidobacteriota bacterium]